MGWFRKTSDPLDLRAREVERKLARLQTELAQFDGGFKSVTLGSSARSPGTIARSDSRIEDPVFEEIDPLDIRPHRAPAPQPENLEALGMDKRRANSWKFWRHSFGADSVSNPRLVKMLSSGNLHGLQPLRHEKRVARNHFIIMFLALLFVLFLVFSSLTRNY